MKPPKLDYFNGLIRRFFPQQQDQPDIIDEIKPPFEADKVDEFLEDIIKIYDENKTGEHKIRGVAVKPELYEEFKEKYLQFMETHQTNEYDYGWLGLVQNGKLKQTDTKFYILKVEPWPDLEVAIINRDEKTDGVTYQTQGSLEYLPLKNRISHVVNRIEKEGTEVLLKVLTGETPVDPGQFVDELNTIRFYQLFNASSSKPYGENENPSKKDLLRYNHDRRAIVQDYTRRIKEKTIKPQLLEIAYLSGRKIYSYVKTGLSPQKS